MKPSNRKIMKKIGAGLMLGLSLFNLGAAWNKANGWNTMKRSKRLRIKEKDQLDAEEAIIAQVAEDEAEKAIKENSVSQQQQATAVRDLSLSQKLYRAVAIGTISIAVGIFATSMIFNTPFAIGKGMLSLLPGNPHLAVWFLKSNKEEVHSEENFMVMAGLDSAGETVDKFKLVVEYNPNLITFNSKNFSESFLIQENQVSDNKRELIIKNKSDFAPKIFSKEDLVELEFQSKKMTSKNEAVISINQEKSLIVSKNNGMSRNILGDSEGTSLLILGDINKDLRCQKIEKVVGTVGFWKNFVAGSDSVDRSGYWQDLGDTGIICGYSKDYIYLSIVSPVENDMNNFNFISGALEHEFRKPDYYWAEDAYNFYVFQISMEWINEIDEIKLEFKKGLINKKKWPIEGVGKIVFE